MLSADQAKQKAPSEEVAFSLTPTLTLTSPSRGQKVASRARSPRRYLLLLSTTLHPHPGCLPRLPRRCALLRNNPHAELSRSNKKIWSRIHILSH